MSFKSRNGRTLNDIHDCCPAPSSQVWWLTPQRRDWVVAKHPDLVQVTKTDDTPFEQFQEQRIKVVNDDWGTPLEKLRYITAQSIF